MFGKAMMRSLLAAAVMLAAVAAQAITIDMVPVGNPGNLADTRYYSPGYGSVGYTYQIGKFEVTAAQYSEFLNAVAATDTYGLYSSYMWTASPNSKIQQSGSPGSYTYTVAADYANRPVTYVNFWDMCRFANWLHNGQPGLVTPVPQNANSTEDGAYTLNGYTGTDQRTIARNPGARWWIPSEDEWYKAAYYDPNKAGGAGYWDYPTKSNTPPINTLLSPDPGNHSNYYDDLGTGNGTYTLSTSLRLTMVGAFANSASAYGTFDQGGNVTEIVDTLLPPSASYNWKNYHLGGGWYVDSLWQRADHSRTVSGPPGWGGAIGFRVAYVPEPASIMLLVTGAVVFLIWRRRPGKTRTLAL
jgi:formylglycine-generating enzyme required for sulfatase activity